MQAFVTDGGDAAETENEPAPYGSTLIVCSSGLGRGGDVTGSRERLIRSLEAVRRTPLGFRFGRYT